VQLDTIVQPVSGKGTSVPVSFSLSAAAPNPFKPATTISYEVRQPGRYQITWNAHNADGALVASGVYLYLMNSRTDSSDSRRMTLLK
jgi:hypothetical protein